MGTLACSSATPPLSGPACPLPRGQWPHKTYLSPLLKPGDLEDYAAAGLLLTASLHLSQGKRPRCSSVRDLTLAHC